MYDGLINKLVIFGSVEIGTCSINSCYETIIMILLTRITYNEMYVHLSEYS